MLESHPGIPLKEHLLSVKEKVKEYAEDVGLDENLRKTAELIGLTHDLGKSTSYFQRHLKGERVDNTLSSHALLSAVISLWHFAKNLPLREKFLLFLSIKSHHSKPTNILKAVSLKHDWEDLEVQSESILRNDFLELINDLGLKIHPKDKLIPSFREFNIDFGYKLDSIKKDLSLYFYVNLLLGMLVDADIRSVIGESAHEGRKEVPDNIVDRFITTLDKNSPLSQLRDEFYKTVLKNIQKYALDYRLFSITAPTGIGKTLTGFSGALKLRNLIYKRTGKLPRIIYVLPFTSIIDQTYDVIKKVLKYSDIPEEILIKHHYRSSVSNKKLKVMDIWRLLEEDKLLKSKDTFKAIKVYSKAHNRVETWDAEIIVTTFVRFFETLFTDRRSEMRRLHNLAGSIVILDEVQNIPVKYWELTEETLKFLSENLSTHFILMTATKPALLENAPELTEPKKEVFFGKMSRTKLNIDTKPLPYTDIENWLIPKVRDRSNFMVIMNTIRSAQMVYNMLKDKLPHKLYFLSASLIPIHREEVISNIKKDLKWHKRIGVISTQVVEAGVDIDFETVIRDFAPLDSIVQAAGRCNRNAENKNVSNVYLQYLNAPEDRNRALSLYIYDSVLIEATKEFLTKYNILEEKNYLSLVENYYKEIKENRLPQDKEILGFIKALNYEEVGKFTIIEDEMPTIPVFVEYDDNASALLEKLESIESLKIDSYEKKMAKRDILKTIMPNLYGYVVNVPPSVLLELRLPTLPYFSSFLYLAREHPDFDNIYDKETGFTREVKQSTIFL